ncbi:MAG TPA: DUF3553 domain-containing protein [Phycisphaerales bacterium]|nr:DUF3553 domain-containing protein [Phycisphaerales bacterium]HMP38114.1 DUF3553 domain-containing protein [Phycisphaerales bacterium]
MTYTPFTAGELLRHPQRPEWGQGTVQRVETVSSRGKPDQRLWIRFSNAGLKTLLSSVAGLERIEPAADSDELRGGTLAEREVSGETGWLGQISKRRPEDAMTELPAIVSDPFVPATRRLEFLLKLYRFNPFEKLLDWAVAQSGLGDPLSRFSRHELEQQFRLWAVERDSALGRLIQDPELRMVPEHVRQMVNKSGPAAQQAYRRALMR